MIMTVSMSMSVSKGGSNEEEKGHQQEEETHLGNLKEQECFSSSPSVLLQPPGWISCSASATRHFVLSNNK